MSFFTDPQKYPYNEEGDLFLGLNDKGKPVGVTTERHALTIAGARSGKGACLLIPNAQDWNGNLLVVDVKGEIVEAAWEARGIFWGDNVKAIDPFEAANIPEKLRASFNPLDAIDPQSPTAREDLQVLADGMVVRSDPKHEEWYTGAADILAGLMAYVVETAPPALQTLTGMRALLLQPDDDLFITAQTMLNTSSFGGLAKAAGIALMTGIKAQKGMEKDFLSAARRSTKWLDSEPIAKVLSKSDFKLSDLKSGYLKVFLVLPPEYIETHSAFLRLFVRLGIGAMMKGGAKINRRCLFLLDEFHSLGKLDIVAKSAGLMGGYGLHLWPFMQDLGQLQTLYGDKLAQTFFANSDATCFFGISDPLTLEYVSKNCGDLTPDEVRDSLPRSKAWLHNKGLIEKIAKTTYENATNQYQHDMRQHGQPRLPPKEVAALIAKRNGDVVARKMLVFAKGGDVLLVNPLPYFDDKLPYDKSVKARIWIEKVRQTNGKWLQFWSSMHMFWFWPLTVTAITLWTEKALPSLSALLFSMVLAIPSILLMRLVKPLFRQFDTFWHRLVNNRV